MTRPGWPVTLSAYALLLCVGCEGADEPAATAHDLLPIALEHRCSPYDRNGYP